MGPLGHQPPALAAALALLRPAQGAGNCRFFQALSDLPAGGAGLAPAGGNMIDTLDYSIIARSLRELH
jgi:hypothetical protein